jgi:hypothetical protein
MKEAIALIYSFSYQSALIHISFTMAFSIITTRKKPRRRIAFFI